MRAPKFWLERSNALAFKFKKKKRNEEKDEVSAF